MQKGSLIPIILAIVLLLRFCGNTSADSEHPDNHTIPTGIVGDEIVGGGEEED